MFIYLVGLITLVFALYQFLSLVSRYTRPGLSLPSLGPWALVTGATDGIGKGFAHQLAKRGINVVLVSRNKDKLTQVATEIEEKFDVKTKVIDIDFTKDRIAQRRIEAEITDLNIGILINNVGVSYDYPEYFLQIDNGAAKCRDIVECNIMSVLDVTRAVLPGMLERKTGAVLNISSFLAYGGPLLSVYAASKAFVMQLSEDLNREYRDQGVSVTCAAPYYVASNMSKIRQSSLTVPSPDTYAASVLAGLGLATSSAGYWPHDLITLAIRALGSVGQDKLFGMLKQIRARALRKKSKLTQ